MAEENALQATAAGAVTDALPTAGIVAGVGSNMGATPEPRTDTVRSIAFVPITTQEDFDVAVRDRIRRSREQLEPQVRQATLAEVQPQLDEYAALKEAQKTEFERLAGQVTQLTTENLTLAQRAAAADRLDMIYAVLAERQERLPMKFWPLVEGSSGEEVAASIDSLMADAKALVGPPGNGQPAGAPPPAEIGLGSPASPPAIPQARPAAPRTLEQRAAQLDAIRRGDPDAVAANIKQHLPQVGPQR